MAIKPLCAQLQDDLDSVVNRYRGEGLTLWEGIAALEVIKLNLWRECAPGLGIEPMPEDAEEDPEPDEPWKASP